MTGSTLLIVLLGALVTRYAELGGQRADRFTARPAAQVRAEPSEPTHTRPRLTPPETDAAMAESPYLGLGSGQPPQPEPAAGQPREPRVSRSARASFWRELTLAEQEALRSVAARQDFRAGDRLMREGDQADHVMVIIEGHTRIVVDENGRERVLAERGPGELIGERSGLQHSVRSASVIAQEAAAVLTVGTEDFTAFVNAYPRVFDIVERQLYDRLTQPIADRPAAYEVMQPLWNGQNCTILFSDVVAFSSRDRNDGDRLAIRKALLEMTLFVLRGIPGAWSQDRGDGLLTVVPPSIPTADVMTLLHRELPAALDRHNSTGDEPIRFQLRIAVNVGPVTSDTIGVSGEAIIIAARLLEAPAFKNAIATSSANLGIIAPPFVFDTAIRHCLNSVELVGYSRIQAVTKGCRVRAWVKLFGRDHEAYFQPSR
jgi:CRP-like cAMP-binding protein